jgi:hypothetical protein
VRRNEALWYLMMGWTYEDHSVAFRWSASRMIAPFVDQGSFMQAGCDGGGGGGNDGDEGVVEVLVWAALDPLCALVGTIMGMEGEVTDRQQWAHNLLY